MEETESSASWWQKYGITSLRAFVIVSTIIGVTIGAVHYFWYSSRETECLAHFVNDRLDYLALSKGGNRQNAEQQAEALACIAVRAFAKAQTTCEARWAKWVSLSKGQNMVRVYNEERWALVHASASSALRGGCEHFFSGKRACVVDAQATHFRLPPSWYNWSLYAVDEIGNMTLYCRRD